MRVLYVPDKPEQYGATISLIHMIKCLSSMGVEPVILTQNDAELAEFSRNNGFEYHIIKYPAFMVEASNSKIKQVIKKIILFVKLYVGDIIAVHKIGKVIDFSTIDIVHTNVNRNDLGALISKRHKITHLWHIREFADLDYNCFSIRPRYIKFMNNHTDMFIAISDAVKTHWVRKGIDSKKIVTIYNGVPSQINKKKDLSREIRIVFVGALRESKGQFFFLKALKKVRTILNKNIIVDFYGTGKDDYINKLIDIVRGDELEGHVRFKGYVENLQDVLCDYEIGVVCSRAEGFGRVTAEYMMAGLCVIASNTGANCELIEDGISGIIYNYNDIDSLVNAIIKAISDENRDVIGQAARKRAKMFFTEERNALQIYNLYRKVSKSSLNCMGGDCLKT